MKKLPTLCLLVGTFVLGGGMFYFQSVLPVEEVRLYGETEEASMSESSKSSVLPEETKMSAEIKKKSPELAAEESSEKTANEYDWKDMEGLPSKNLEEQPIPQPDTVGTGLVAVRSEAQDWTEHSDQQPAPQPVEPYQEDSLKEAESFSDEEVREVLLKDALYTTSNANVTTGTTQYPDCDTKDIIISNGTSSYTIAACNVGATVAGTWPDSDGALFQWGNNYRFPNAQQQPNVVTPNSTTIFTDASSYWPSNPYYSGTYILCNSSNSYCSGTYDRAVPQNDNLWWGAGDTSSANGAGTDVDRQWPCAAGYHVPSIVEWKGIYNAGGRGSSSWTQLSNDLLLPMAGVRRFENGLPFNRGSEGSYRLSSPRSSSAYRLIFFASDVYPRDNYYRAIAFPVRCVKNSISVPSVPSVPSVTSLVYSPASRTSGSVTVTVTLDQNVGATFDGWTANGRTFTKTYTTNTTETVTFPSTLGGTVSTGISVQNIDTTVPSVDFSPNGGAAYASNHSTTVTVTDTGAGVDTSSLKYQRSTSATAPAESTFTTPFTNGETLTLSGTNGEFYLRILAKDTVGNTTIVKSNVFNIDTSISIYPWCDTADIKVWTYTIAACNVGATAAGTGETSYGSLFQRGNNYGFENTNTSVSTSSSNQVDASDYWPANPYYSGTFIKGYSDRSSSRNDNLWWDTSGTDVDRQWPCAAGYHVPSTVEWQGIYDAGGRDSIDSNRGTQMSNDLLLPMAGNRDYSGSPNRRGSSGFYRSSSPDSSYAYLLDFYTSSVYPQNYADRALAFPVRCVKNSISVPSVSSLVYSPASRTSGSVTVTVTLDQDGATLTGWTVNGKTFTKTYTTNTTETVTFPSTLGGTVSTGISVQNIDTTVPSVDFSPNGGAAYASNHSTTVTVTDTGAGVDTSSLKYQRSTSATAPAESTFTTPFTNGATLTLSGTNGEFYLWILAKDTVGNTAILSSNIFNIDTSISIYPWCDTADIKVWTYTIAACNVGATAAGTGETSYGSLFQRGNNFRFSNNATNAAPTPNTSTKVTNAANYWPANPYNSNTYVFSSSDWAEPKNDNLWWGAGDTYSQNGAGTDVDRQWPCTAGYHVPSTVEWKGIYDAGGGSSYGNRGTQMSNDLLLPMAGLRRNDDGLPDDRGSNGYYRSSSPDSSYAYILYFSASYVYPQLNYDRAVAFSVRCIKHSISVPSVSSLVYSPASRTSGSVTVTVTLDQDGATLAGWTANGKTFTKTFTSNWSGTVTFPSVAGGEISTGINVRNIDKNPPTITAVLSDITSPTSGSVTLTIDANDGTGAGLHTIAYSFDDGANWQTGNTKSYTTNTTLNVKVRDSVGNISAATQVNINNIDKSIPTLALVGDPKVTIEIFSGRTDPGAIWADNGLTGWVPGSWMLDTGAIGEYTLLYMYTDPAGNAASWTRTVEVVDVPPSPPGQPSTSWGGGGKSLQKDRCPNGDFSPSYYDGRCEVTLISKGGSSDPVAWYGGTVTGDFPWTTEHWVADASNSTSIYHTAYEWAKGYGITTADTYEAARISDAIIRAEMAKMISTFATKLFQKTPDTEKFACTQFDDLHQANDDLQPYIVTSCQLGLMGMHGDGIGVQESFFPARTITRAEVGTILSRLLRGTTYATQPGDETYYGRHLQALKNADIMKAITQPEMLELRGNILQMLMKSVKK